MVDLGKYAAEVLISYGVSIFLLVGIVAVSVRRARKVRDELQIAEKATKNG